MQNLALAMSASRHRAEGQIASEHTLASTGAGNGGFWTMGLREIMLEELRDLYSAENQLVKALPKLAKAAEDDELKQSFSEHLEETKGHVERLKQAFLLLDEKPTGKHCKGMEGLIEEGKEAIDEEEEGEAYDIGLIGAGARVEHYEIAGYTAVIAMLKGLGLEEAAELLVETLDEENAALETLESKIQQLIVAAAESGALDEEEGEEGDTATPQIARASRSRK
jgi:ferritin-like metal-binding protein YciE